MHNRPLNRFSINRSEAGRRWQVDAHPARRLGWLFALLLLPMVAIAGRLVYLQGVVSIGYFDARDTTTVSYEWIPARAGRILSADGRVLAEDAVRYELHVHYRWLEQPADPGWLRRRALSRLEKKARRNRQRVLATEKEVLREREAVWLRLARLTGTSSAELTTLRADVQKRIERMVQSVERRRNAENVDASAFDKASMDDGDTVSRMWRIVVKTVTTPPKRGRDEPIVLPEQSDYQPLIADVSANASAEIAANPELYPGVRIRIAGRRTYPERTLAAHLIGHRLPEQEESPESFTDETGETMSLSLPAMPTTIGRTGLEKSYDSLLRGRPGLRKVVRNTRGEILRTEILRQPQPGRDVVATIEAGIQQRVEALLDENIIRSRSRETSGRKASDHRPNSHESGYESGAGGAIVVLDVQTGAVLAAASAPRFDLNVFTQPDAELWKKLTSDKRRPFFPRSYRMALPPGSVFKAVSSFAVLDAKAVDPEQRLDCRGYLDRPDRHRCYIYRHFGVGHGPLNLTDAICRSCNVYFFTAARKMGPKPLLDWAQRFGFGAPTGLDLPGEKGGNLPSPFHHSPLATHHSPGRWYPGDTLGLAIGQSRLTATPMQITRMMAAIANGGYLVTPHLLGRVSSASRASMTESPGTPFPRLPIPGLRDTELQRVRQGLENVVQNPHGTGYKTARVSGIEYAGKTGTAEVGGNRPDHAWFAGYAPAKNPRIAFAIVLEHAGSGGREAGPVAKQLVQLLLDSRVIPSRVASRN